MSTYHNLNNDQEMLKIKTKYDGIKDLKKLRNTIMEIY